MLAYVRSWLETNAIWRKVERSALKKAWNWPNTTKFHSWKLLLRTLSTLKSLSSQCPWRSRRTFRIRPAEQAEGPTRKESNLVKETFYIRIITSYMTQIKLLRKQRKSRELAVNDKIHR